MSLSETQTGECKPRHVALIMDGNGRWARNRGRFRLFGHRNGVENVRRVVETARKAGVPYMTLYAFSEENQKRPPEEVRGLMRLLKEFLKKELAAMMRDGVRLRAIGDLDGLPDFARETLEETIEETKGNDDHNLTLALNYGSRQETLRAVRSFAEKVAAGKAEPSDLNWEVFAEGLDTAGLPDPDLIIRTSGEFRLSNFLLLQAAYAEIYVTPLLWPEFGRDEFLAALKDFAGRERRYGRTGEQLSEGPNETGEQDEAFARKAGVS